MIDAVEQVTGQAALRARDIPWQAVAKLHPSRTWTQLCHKWATVFYHDPGLIARRGQPPPEWDPVRCLSNGFFCSLPARASCSMPWALLAWLTHTLGMTDRWPFSRRWPTRAAST